MEQKEYIGSLTQTAGIRLLVHRPDHYPFPEDDGTDISVGLVTDVRVRRVSTITFINAYF